MKRQLLSCCVLGVPAGAMALGIRLFDHDAFATARGNAFVATADNPSAIYYNPAGISQLQGHNVRGGIYGVSAHTDVDPQGGAPDFGTGSDIIPLPGFYYTYGADDFPISFGAAYYMPYGLSIEWPDHSLFSKITTDTDLQYHTISGVAAWKVCDSFSLAAGPTFNFSTTRMERRGVTSAGDQFAFRGDGSTLGAVAGLLWKPAPEHAFGLSYRSETSMSYRGHTSLGSAPMPVQSAQFDLVFPQVVVAGYSFRPSTNWNAELDVDWTDWNRVHTPVIRQSAGVVPLPLNWDSSWALELGLTRYLQKGLHVGAGYSFIENSTPSGTFNPVVPDQDLHVFSGGIGGQHFNLSWDLTYQFSYGPGRSVSGSVYGPSVSGEYTFFAHAVSLSVGWRF